MEEGIRSCRDGAGAGLDLYCGTQPYRSLLAGTCVVGVDIDRHFGRADLIGDMPLPLRSGAFGVVTCTQALYFRSDDVRVVAEMQRVLEPGGCAVVTVPHLWRRDYPSVRRYGRADLADLLSQKAW